MVSNPYCLVQVVADWKTDTHICGEKYSSVLAHCNLRLKENMIVLTLWSDQSKRGQQAVMELK